MSRFKVSDKICMRLQELNEKYSILSFDLEFDNLFDFGGFFDLATQTNTDYEDRIFIEYAFDMFQLCELEYKTQEDIQEFKEHTKELLFTYENKLLKFNELFIKE